MNTNPLAIAVFICGTLLVLLAVYAWKRPSISGARMFSFSMFSQAVYVLGYAMELASMDISRMLFWSRIQYLGILTFPTLYMLFIVEYIHQEKWLTRRNVIIAFMVPAVLLFFKMTDDRFHLIYSATTLDSSGMIPLLNISRGPLYMVMVAYNLLVVTVGNFLLWKKRQHSSALFRKQSMILMIAAVSIYIVFGIHISGIQIIPSLKHLDLNPFIYILWGLAIGWAIFRYRLFDLMPIARDALIETLSDGVLVLDSQNRLVDANPAALRIFGWSKSLVENNIEQVLDNWNYQATRDQHAVSFNSDESAVFEIQHEIDGGKKYFDINMSPLRNEYGTDVGRLIVMHDITARKNAEERQRELSLTDDLTGLNNRRGFNMLSNQLLQMAQRMKLNAVLVYADLDGMKAINDNLGHSAGDQALIDTAEILKTTFRSSDIIARMGGDEFVILAIEGKINTWETIRGRFQEQIEIWNRIGKRPYQLSISLGLARYEAENPNSLERLLEMADKAMYEVKQAKKSDQA